jgi:hypothetical protein
MAGCAVIVVKGVNLIYAGQIIQYAQAFLPGHECSTFFTGQPFVTVDTYYQHVA